MFTKNLTADLTNPNVYNSYEDPLKMEHVYDEIKQKEGYNNPGEYISVTHIHTRMYTSCLLWFHL